MATVYANCGIEAAKAASSSPELLFLAQRVRQRIVSVSAPHYKTGNYARSVHIAAQPGPRGVTDQVVYSSDPNALSIEFGHWLVNRETGEDIKWVRGLFIFVRALGLVARGVGIARIRS